MNQKQARTDILISDNVDFRAKTTTKDTETLHNGEGSIHQENIT